MLMLVYALTDASALHPGALPGAMFKVMPKKGKTSNLLCIGKAV
jgi:hypothetical protein